MIATDAGFLQIPRHLLYRFYRRIVINTRSFSSSALEHSFRRAYESYGHTFIQNLALLGTFYYAGVFLSNLIAANASLFEPAQIYRLSLGLYLFSIYFAARKWSRCVQKYRVEIYVGIATGAIALTNGLADASAQGTADIARYYLSLTITSLFYIFSTYTIARLWVRDTFLVSSIVSLSTVLLAYNHAGLNADFYRMVLHLILANIIGSIAYIFFVRREKLLFLTQLRSRKFFEMRRKKELLEASDSAKLNFLATMSHEVRTPIASIITSMSMLDRGRLSERDQRHLTASLESANTLLFTLNDILDFSKIDSNSSAIAVEPFYPVELIGGVCNSFHSQLQMKGNSIKFKVDDQSDGALFYGDRGKLRQVLSNLISNANKFTCDGQISVQAIVSRMCQSSSWSLCVSIIDTGLGIAPEHIDSLFVPFFQANSKERGEGVGLGLPICKRILDLLGGSITVNSTLGQGSSFTVTVPLIQRADSPPRSPAIKRESRASFRFGSDSSSLRGKVMLIEDNEDNALVTASLMNALGLECTVAYNGAEAIQLFQNQKFDLVFMDYEMPVMNGIDASQRIREIDLARHLASGDQSGSLNRTPIVGLTARSDADSDPDFLVDELLRKPYDLEALHSCIVRWIPQTEAVLMQAQG